MLRIGLVLSNPATTPREAREAEELGFDLLAVGEHIFHIGPAPSPFVQLAAAAAVTTNVRLLSSVHLLPLYPAALSARQAATLDQVSGGRLILGVGAGGEYPREFAAVGVAPSTRFRRLEEGLDLLRLLFTGERVSFSGEFTTATDVRLDPPPAQPGGPPIWLSGRRGGALRRVAKYADTWLPYMVTPQMVSDGLASIRAAATEFDRPANAVAGALFAFTCVDDDGEWARRTGTALVGAGYDQDFSEIADRYLLLGTPDQVSRRILEFYEAGAQTIVLGVAAPPGDRARVLATLTQEVLPAVREASRTMASP